MSEPYLEEDYAEPAGEELEPAQDQIAFDPETIQQMVDWAVEERLGREAGIDEWEADYEQRQAAEDAALAEQERQDEAARRRVRGRPARSTA